MLYQCRTESSLLSVSKETSSIESALFELELTLPAPAGPMTRTPNLDILTVRNLANQRGPKDRRTYRKQSGCVTIPGRSIDHANIPTMGMFAFGAENNA